MRWLDVTMTLLAFNHNMTFFLLHGFDDTRHLPCFTFVQFARCAGELLHRSRYVIGYAQGLSTRQRGQVRHHGPSSDFLSLGGSALGAFLPPFGVIASRCSERSEPLGSSSSI